MSFFPPSSCPFRKAEVSMRDVQHVGRSLPNPLGTCCKKEQRFRAAFEAKLGRVLPGRCKIVTQSGAAAEDSGLPGNEQG